MSTVTASAPGPSRAPHPVIWTLLYLPFGALGGFVGVALTFLATRSGLSVTEGATLAAASLLSAWLKWLWAPIVDVTLTPKRWYVISTVASALGVLAMSMIPLSPETLPLLLAVIAIASLINSIVGMAIEAILAAVTLPTERGRVSAWFQAGNLGGAGLGGGIGLYLLERVSEPWHAGAIMGALFLACCGGLLFVPDVKPHVHEGGPLKAAVGVLGDLKGLFTARSSLLAAFLCFLPIGTGAASGALTQEGIAGLWGAGSDEVALLQGFLAAGVTALGCFIGGWLCDRFSPRMAYAGIGLLMAAVATGMALSPQVVEMYVFWNLSYSLVVGFAYAAFTAVVLEAIGTSSAATKYNLFASLSNFPIWWLGLVLGAVADRYGAQAMLFTEAGFGLLGVGVFAVTWKLAHRKA